MRITLSAALIGLLAWDYSAAAPGQSAVERFYKVADPAIIRPAGAFLRKHFGEMQPLFATLAHATGESLMSYSESERSSPPHSGDVSAVPVAKRAAQAAVPAVQVVQAAQHETGIAALPAPQATEKPAPAPVQLASADAQNVADDLSPLLLSTNEEPFRGSCVQAVMARPSLINSAITAAGRTTSSSLDYLVHVAILESRLRTYAQAPTSSAAGLFQFTRQTWLALLKRHGADHDLGYYADAIKTGDGHVFTVDPKLADTIFGLRQDPTVAAVMAAELAKENADIMSQALDREASDGELYAAHFLGAQDAVKLIRAVAATPSLSSSRLFPQAAKSNPWIFRSANGEDRSVSDLYDLLTRKPSAAEVSLFCKEGYRPPQLTARS